MKKYIQDDILLTREAIVEHILKQRIEQAKRYGLTLEQFMEAVVNGDVVQSAPPTGSL